MRTPIVVIALLAAGSAWADRDPVLAKLESELPAGWSMLATDSELVLRHDRPCYLAGVAADSAGPLVTLELRYRVEPKWTAKQLADARATNDRLAAELHESRTRGHIEAIRSRHHTAEEQARLDAYAKSEASVRARTIQLPMCTLGTSSLFDGPDTYSQLSLSIDPASAVTEARRIVELVKKSCS